MSLAGFQFARIHQVSSVRSDSRIVLVVVVLVVVVAAVDVVCS